MAWLFVLLVALTAVTLVHLRGSSLRQFDSPPGQRFSHGDEPSEEHDAVVASLQVGASNMRRGSRSQRLAVAREYMDNISQGLQLDATITPVDVQGIPAEWVLAPGADPDRRVLYIHGGAFMMGSPRSHRNITNRFSEVSGAAVLAIDYRLMPENTRMAGIEDCRNAYLWILDNGPAGASAPAQRVFVGGDSAGGNLALSLIAWVRDQGLRAPDAAVALSPATDSTFGSPSLKRNLETDAMLGPTFSILARVPRPLLWWLSWAQARISPANPVVSPVYGDLSGLPPVLVHASEAEMLYGDALRYVNRARAEGSPARLQSWAHMVHVWHMFYPQLTEAREAWDEIGKFIAEVG
ncbi:MAG: alpha/beta hydrolase [Halieaceae bacterium]|nr:alpha/beta hydrolase [Halieaceae bacterium]MCP5204515.1 alpha/beta hydrolase [Pseudomonadales bacterium]